MEAEAADTAQPLTKVKNSLALIKTSARRLTLAEQRAGLSDELIHETVRISFTLKKTLKSSGCK